MSLPDPLVGQETNEAVLISNSFLLLADTDARTKTP